MKQGDNDIRKLREMKKKKMETMLLEGEEAEKWRSHGSEVERLCGAGIPDRGDQWWSSFYRTAVQWQEAQLSPAANCGHTPRENAHRHGLSFVEKAIWRDRLVGLTAGEDLEDHTAIFWSPKTG